MKCGSCADMARLGSAYVDGALPPDDRESLQLHLVDCPSCRGEVADLRRTQRLLAGTRTGEAPSELRSRLVAIAGAESSAPMWSRPFRRTAAGVLPSSRRARRVRTLAATVVVGSLVAAAAGLGYAAAPDATLIDIADPSRRAQTEFASVLSQYPLAADSVSAAMVASVRGREISAAATVDPPRAPRGHRLHSAQALAVLQRAVQAADEVAFRGNQVVVAPRAGATVSAEVRVAFEPGQGSQVSVLSSTGTPVVDRFVAQPVRSRIVGDEWWSLLSANYAFGGATAAVVAERKATMVEAMHKALIGGVVARWWLDEETGLLLWSETYEQGALVLASGFSAVEFGSTSETFFHHLAPALATPVTTASLTLSNAGVLRDYGWSCSDVLAGLSLVRLRTDSGDDPDVVQLVYSDGLSTVSVFEQRGRLMPTDEDAPWDTDLQAYVRTGASSSASWQSGGTVFTVVTDGPASLLDRAVKALPHGDPWHRTTMERVRAGWVRILEHIVG